MDARHRVVRALNTPHHFRPPVDAAAWTRRADDLRLRVLAAAGLRPMPPRPPVRPRVAGRLERSGYRVENVWFETGRGLYVAGNLYVPEGPGPFPAVLHPHGHWEEGRAADDDDGSSQAFCIHLARAGYVAFAWDMIGFNDTQSLPHDFHDPRAARLGITLCGLQLWNSLRAVDFLSAHPLVDAWRIGIAGASGGATQAFLLCAIDDRVQASALVCMVSCRMQGGCLCENAPGLRVGTDNVELAALMAPRPLLLVSATGDWTADTPREGFPAIRRVYRLLGAARNAASLRFRLPHNLLRESREAIYRWFARHLGGRAVREGAYRAEPVQSLLAFADGKLPPLPRGRDLVARLAAEARRRAHDDPAALATLAGVAWPERVVEGRGWIGRVGEGDRVPVRWKGEGGRVTLVFHDGRVPECPDGRAAIVDVFGAGRAVGPDRRAAHLRVARRLSRQLSRWSGGSFPPPTRVEVLLDAYFDVYNPTDDALRVQDILTAMAWLSGRGEPFSVLARGRAASWVRAALAIARVRPPCDLRGGGPLDLPCAELYLRSVAGSRGLR